MDEPVEEVPDRKEDTFQQKAPECGVAQIDAVGGMPC